MNKLKWADSKKHTLLRLTHEEIESLNRSISSKETEPIFKNLTTKKII